MAECTITAVGQNRDCAFLGVAFLGVGSLAFGCGGGSSELDGPGDVRGGEPQLLGSIQQALEESSCATTAPTAVLTGQADYDSPRTYNASGCFKAVVVDVTDLGFEGQLMAHNTSAPPTSQVACERLWLGSNLYVSLDGAFEKIDFKSARGVWTDGLVCVMPQVTFEFSARSSALTRDEIETMDGSFRITASARTNPTSRGATREVNISYFSF